MSKWYDFKRFDLVAWEYDPSTWKGSEISDRVDLTFAIKIYDALRFLSELPDHLRPPSQSNPHGRLPKNVWVGGKYDDVWPEILDVRSRIRFLVVDGLTSTGQIMEFMEAWRCSNCGQRAPDKRPRRCPRAGRLCGDAKIDPQIHWVVDLGVGRADKEVKELVEAAGAAYWSPSSRGFPSVR